MSEGIANFPRTVTTIESGQGRLHHGAQVFVSQHGRMLADFAVGENQPGRPLHADTILPWLSAGKPVTAVVVLSAMERGELQLDDPVAKFLPEFARHGKDAVTIRHLLTHTANFPQAETGWPEATWEESIRRICDAVPEADWSPGHRAAYHPASSWFLLGEIVQRVTGRTLADVVQEDVFRPLGMTQARLAIPPFDEPRLGSMYERSRDGLVEWQWAAPERAGRASPGSSLSGPARDLGRFYEMLLNGGEHDGGRVLTPQSVTLMTAVHRRGLFDETFQHVVDFGLGVVLDSKQYGADTVPYGYGRYASAHTFGHGGSQSSVGYADPEHGLAVVIIANGRPGEPQHQRRNRAVNEAIYQDLGLAH